MNKKSISGTNSLWRTPSAVFVTQSKAKNEEINDNNDELAMHNSHDSDRIRMPWESSEDSSPPSYYYSGRRPAPLNSQQPRLQQPNQMQSQQQQQPQSQPQSQLHSDMQSPMSSQQRISRQQAYPHQMPSTPPQPEFDGVMLQEFSREMLLAHNRYRAMHQVPPLKLDRDLTRGAQEWAELIARNERLEPDTDVKNAHIGENLAMKYNSERTDFTGRDFTDYWYSGIDDYDFVERTPRLQHGSAVLSFTQIVWKATEVAGFGRAVSRNGRVYVVARYFPGGNSVEGFATNVLPVASRSSSRKQSSLRPSSTIMKSSGSRISELMEPPIGAMKPNDRLVSTSKTTSFEKNRTVVTIEEKYQAEDGSTYTRQRKTTYYGDQRPRE